MKFKIPAWIKLIFFAAAIIAAARLGYSFRDPNMRETFGEKSEWADLQGIEFSHRADNITKPQFLSLGDDEWMGLRGLDGKNVWILLNPTSPPYYKQMPPKSGFLISQKLIDQLVRENRLGSTTEQVLESHAMPEELKH